MFAPIRAAVTNVRGEAEFRAKEKRTSGCVLQVSFCCRRLRTDGERRAVSGTSTSFVKYVN